MADRRVQVVVLSKFPEYFEGFRESVERDRGVRGGIVVWDAPLPLQKAEPEAWLSVRGPELFHIAHNANIGFSLTNDNDVLYCGDDVRFYELGAVEALQGLAYSDPQIGIVSPKIIGHAQSVQMNPPDVPLSFTNWLAFVCVYIKREVFDSIGYLDEQFFGYGMEDLDYCYRTRRAGFKIAVAHDVSVRHGLGGMNYGSTFRKVKTETQMAAEDAENRRRFAEKWGLRNEPSAIFSAMERVPAAVSQRW